MDTIQDIHGVRVLVCAVDGPRLAAERDINDFVSLAWEHKADMIAIPVPRLDESFFRLSTGLAGATLQKLVNYNVRLAVLGDISSWVAASKPLHDFVYESNRGRMAWFVDDVSGLEQRLAP
jgi:hypothetical protein